MVLAVIIACGFLMYRGFHRAADFERKAQRAEQVAAQLQPKIDSLQAHVDSLQLVTVQRDTVLKVLQHNVVVMDSLHPPPDTCRPNLAVRDSVIMGQGRQIVDLTSALQSERSANVLLRQIHVADSAALVSRPKLFPRFLGPHLSLGLQLGVDPTTVLSPHPTPRLGVGLSINFVGIRL